MSTTNIVRKRLYPIKPKSHKWKYEVGDSVRIAMPKRPFRKGYLGNWSHEIFEIKSRLHNNRLNNSKSHAAALLAVAEDVDSCLEIMFALLKICV